LLGHLDELTLLAADEARSLLLAPAVSAWSIAQHVDHLAIAHRLILEVYARLLAAPPDARRPADQGRPSLMGRLVLLTGFIPRGVGKAPPPTRPADRPEPAAVRAHLDAYRQVLEDVGRQLDRLLALPVRPPHPRFGPLDAVGWLRFIEIHERHHLKIVADIERRSAWR
jgi:hypothetical protein